MLKDRTRYAVSSRDFTSSALKGQSVMSYVPKEGLTVNWGLSKTAPAVGNCETGSLANGREGF